MATAQVSISAHDLRASDANRTRLLLALCLGGRSLYPPVLRSQISSCLVDFPKRRAPQALLLYGLPYDRSMQALF